MPLPRDKSYPCTIWTHSDVFSKEPVLFNRSSIANGAIPLGSLVSLVRSQRAAENDNKQYGSQPFVFRAQDLPQELKSSANIPLSINEKIAKAYGLSRRLPVILSVVDPQLHSASHVELSYRDVQLDRSDMWRLCTSRLHGRALFQGQTINFLESINLTVKSIYVRGRKVHSGVFADSSLPVFRSETARYIILIQMSKEMWDFDLDSSGETLWTKCIDGFLPELFDHWAGVNARHLLTFVLFTRLQYNRGRPDAHFKDYYRVVASEIPSNDSVILLQRVRQDFVFFLRDVETQIASDGTSEFVDGTPSTAAQGNFLEAVNLATSHLSRESNDLDLLRTESAIIVVSPGVALMEADREVLNLTTERAISSGFAVDLVCLAQQPLHAVPLFKVRRSSPSDTSVGGSEDKSATETLSSSLRSSPGQISSIRSGSLNARNGSATTYGWSFIRPSWVVTSFYSRRVSFQKSKIPKSSYLPTCRMYQIQSMGISQHEKVLTIPRLNLSAETQTELAQLTEHHDKEMFGHRGQDTVSSSPSRSRATTASHETSANRSTNIVQPITATKPANLAIEQDTATTIATKRVQDRTAAIQPVSHLKRTLSPAPSLSSLSSKKSLGFLKLNNRLGKSTVTTSATVESAEPTWTYIRHSSSDSKTEYAKDSISHQFKMSLSRTASASNPPQLAPPTQPIPIAPSPMLVPADKQKSEELTSSTPKPWSLDRDDAFRAASSLKKSGPSLELRSSGPKQSATPREDMAPWLIHMTTTDATPRNHDTFAGWKHVFVPNTAISAIKWKTLSCPASLPLTTEFVPSVEVLRGPSYTESPYIVSIDEADGQDRFATMLELITRRISKGFQLGVGLSTSKLSGVRTIDNNIFSPDFAEDTSATFVMVRGNTVHLLSCVDNGVAVTRFQRRHSNRGNNGVKYEPKISTIMDKRYFNRVFQISAPPEENWNAIDNFVVGQHSLNPLTSSLGAVTVHRLRFVLLPVEVPAPRRSATTINEDTDEELRIEGIRKLTMLWQGIKSFQRDSHRTSVTRPSKAELSPLAIEYQTRDPSIVVTQGLDNSPLIDGNITVTATRLFGESESYKTSKIDLHRLAADLQGPKGIKMRDRRWHRKTHQFCFEGVELTSFLLANFQDLDSREAAIDFGNVLMGKGLFEHVQSKHRFRDGSFFYKIAPEYRAHRPESKGWFSSRRAEIASPLALPVDSKRIFSPSLRPIDDSSAKRMATDGGRATIMLSSSITFDVDPDPRRKSDRSELITLHYDRLHNPENAFHIMLEWENTTSKLVEEHVASWSIAVEKHGLKLVQTPLAEIGAIGRANPFRTPYIIKLVVAPPKGYVQRQSDDAGPDPPPVAPTEKFKHMKVILRKNGYVLDFEGAFRFPSTVDAKYTWPGPMYSRDQYIHKSGRVLAQIVDDETLIVMVNRLSTSRNNPVKYDKDSLRSETGLQSKQTSVGSKLEAFSSPSARNSWPHKAQAQAVNKRVQGPLSPNLVRLKESLEADCHDRDYLLALYEELAPNANTINTPLQKAARTPSLDGSVASLELPSLEDADPLTLSNEGHGHLDTVLEMAEP